MANPEGAKAGEPYQRSISDRLLPKGRKNFDEEGLRRSPLGFAASLVEELSLLPARSLIACYRRDARTRRSHRIVDGRSMHSWAMPQQSIPLGKAVCIRCYPIFGGVITSQNPPSSHCLSVQRAQSAILGISRGNNKSH